MMQFVLNIDLGTSLNSLLMKVDDDNITDVININ